jgi:hypothetical protein
MRQVLGVSDNKMGDKGAGLIANLLSSNGVLKRMVACSVRVSDCHG